MLRSCFLKAGQNVLPRMGVRSVASSGIRHEIFQVQSTEDFEKKVKKSDKVVIVDFFAT